MPQFLMPAHGDNILSPRAGSEKKGFADMAEGVAGCAFNICCCLLPGLLFSFPMEF